METKWHPSYGHFPVEETREQESKTFYLYTILTEVDGPSGASVGLIYILQTARRHIPEVLMVTAGTA